jgi:hypothetical protein
MDPSCHGRETDWWTVPTEALLTPAGTGHIRSLRKIRDQHTAVFACVVDCCFGSKTMNLEMYLKMRKPRGMAQDFECVGVDASV